MTRWAIVGTGYIANEFATGMQVVKDAVLAAVVSRSQEKGQAFAKKYGGKAVYTDLERMLDQEEIDVVYVAIPNDCHYDVIMKTLERGISVLSEKPMVDNGDQLEAVFAKAREKNVFLMEGMWTRCFPAVRKARSWMEEGRIGRTLTVRSGFDIQPDMEDWQPWKGGIAHSGGSLRDVGIYSLAMAYLAFPEDPQKADSVMEFNGEVDESFHMMLTYEGGRAAFLSGAFNQISSPETEIVGEKGRIVIGPEFWHPTTAALFLNDGASETFVSPYPATGFQYEIMEVQECLKRGEKQSSQFTWEESARIAALIEKTRKGWGIRYKGDK